MRTTCQYLEGACVFCAMLRRHHMKHCAVLAAVGQLAAHSALVKGAEKVAIVDSVQYRMDYVKKWLPEGADHRLLQGPREPPAALIVSLWVYLSSAKIAYAAPSSSWSQRA